MKTKLIFSTLLVSYSLMAGINAHASSIDNLERERAITLAEYLDTNTGVEERWSKLNKDKRRLTELERIALQDKTLKKTTSYQAVRAFKDYERTFLVHASAEFNKTPLIHWMDSIGLTTSNILSTREVK